MKRRQLTQHLEKHGCSILREGGNHTIYHNPDNNRKAPVPRHNEVDDVLARKICRQLDIPSLK